MYKRNQNFRRDDLVVREPASAVGINHALLQVPLSKVLQALPSVSEQHRPVPVRQVLSSQHGGLGWP